MANKKVTASKANMMQMAKNGGLAGFKNGGGTYDGLMKAQKGNNTDIPYPKLNMTSQDSASFRFGFGKPRPGDGFAGISESPFAELGKKAKLARASVKKNKK